MNKMIGLDKKKVVLALMIIIGTISVLICGIKIHQNLNVPYAHINAYLSIEIKNGDTASSIADTVMKKYNMYSFMSMNEMLSIIRDVNNVDIDNIETGNYILVPYYVEK